MLEGNIVNVFDEEQGVNCNLLGKYKVIESNSANTYVITPVDGTSHELLHDYNYKLEYTLNDKAYSCYFNIEKDYVPIENKGLNIHLISRIKLINRRVHERFMCHIALEYDLMNEEKKYALINNISAGGLNFVADSIIESKKELHLKFTLPDEELKYEYNVTGKVVSCMKVNQDKDMYNIHVKFDTLSKIEAEHIIKYVFKIQRKSLEND